MGMGRLIALICALLFGVLIAWNVSRPPAPRPATIPAGEFSAKRAMADVHVIAARPHPQGSPENAAVRAYLVKRLGDLGLSVEVRDNGNIVGVLAGGDRKAPALALMAHYDSVPGSPGAGDDAAGVAAILETVRAVKTGGAPPRDLIVLITDGEESGLLGAKAFFAGDPLLSRIGFVINLEARGQGGRAQMFQTGRPGGGDVRLFQKAAPRPQASSLFAYAYLKMPNDTDFSETLKAGRPGLNFAFIGRQFDYHSGTATPQNLNRGSLQDIGVQVLGSTRAALATLPAPAPDLVYSQTFGDVLIAYPPAVGWLVLAATAILLGAAVARRRKTLPWLDTLRGFGGFFYVLFGAAAALQLARLLAGQFVDLRALTAQPIRWEATLVLIGLGVGLAAIAGLARGRRWTAAVPMALIAVACCGLARGVEPVGLACGAIAAILGLTALSRPTERDGAWTGVLAAGLVLGVAIQATIPAAAFLVAWPLAVAVLAAALTDLGARRAYPALAVIALAAAVVAGWLGGYAHLIFLALDLPFLLALPLTLASLALWPLAQPDEGAPPARLVGVVLMVAGAILLALVCLDPPWSARYPKDAAFVVHVHHR
jgi:hypothetical protein